MFQHKPSRGGDFGKVKDSDQRAEQAPTYWDDKAVDKFVIRNNMTSVKFDGCAVGVKTTDGIPMKKPWTVKTNMHCLHNYLDGRVVNSNLCLKTPKIVEKEDLIFMVYSDAAFGVRRGMASQGGFVVAAARKDTLNGK